MYFRAVIAAFGFALCATHAYDFNDASASHTNQAIKFDTEGRREDSLRSFQAAVRFTPGSETWTNLGVCFMRMGTANQNRPDKENYYHLAFSAMKTAKDKAVSGKEWEHVNENQKALKQSMNAESVDEPYSLEGLDPMMGDLGSQAPTSFGMFSNGGGGGDGGEPPKKRRRKKRKASVHRERLLHQREVPLGRPMARVTVQELDSPDPAFEPYRTRQLPFILTGALDGWGAMDNWPDTWETEFPEMWPDAVCDFYPYNMLLKERQNPYLTRLPRAAAEVMLETGPQQQAIGSAFAYDPTAMEGRYMHLQLTPKMWTELEAKGDINPDRHWHLASDDWLEECLGYPESDIAEEYHLKTHWKIILVGSRGAGMFNHSDSLLTSSWHAHLMGSKWWYVCGTLPSGERGVCFEDYLVPGEVLYYGHGWHHETQNLETPTMTLTDTVAHEHNFMHIADKLHGTCSRDQLRFGFSSAMCDGLDQCYETLHEMHTGEPKPAHRWRPWRSVANAEYIAKAEKINPMHNNYDGRNFITEMWTDEKPVQGHGLTNDGH